MIIEKLREPDLNNKLIVGLLSLFIILIPFDYWKNKDSILSILIFLLWLLNKDFKQNLKSFFSNKVAIIFMSIILLSYLSLMWSSNIDLGLYRLTYYKYYFLILPVIVTIIDKESLVVKLLNYYFIGILFYSFISIYIYIFVNSYDPKPWMHYITFSSLVSFASVLSLLFAIESKILKNKYFYLVLFIVFTFSLFINNSRNAQLAFIITLLFLIYKYYKITWKSIIVTSFVSALIVVLIMQFNHKTYDRFMQGYEQVQSLDYHTNWGKRIAGWACSIQVFKEAPLIGHGMGGHEDRLHQITRVETPEKYGDLKLMDWFHNQYAEIYTTTGTLGFLIFILFLYKFFTLNITNRLLKYSSQSFMILALFIFIGEPILYQRAYAIFFVVMISLYIAASKNSSSKSF